MDPSVRGAGLCTRAEFSRICRWGDSLSLNIDYAQHSPTPSDMSCSRPRHISRGGPAHFSLRGCSPERRAGCDQNWPVWL